MHFIEQYLRDYQAIVKNINESRPDVKASIKKMKENNEII